MLPKHHVAATGIVLNRDGKVLLIRRRDNGNWEPPGGVVELDDSLEGAVVREVKEESGVEADVIRLSGVYKNVGAKGKYVVSLVFLCRAVGGKPTAGDETLEAGWFSPEEAMRLVSRERMRIRLQDALSGREAPAVRSFMTPETRN
ncbi:MAG: NUDIX hydrolase [Thermoactinomycetaceae bacterium]|nr:NUDIX hydrolase [Bacillota bacterium]MBO2531782.1 NUDIX hydrolase [Thermoactinomycetaceae bacterium]